MSSQFNSWQLLSDMSIYQFNSWQLVRLILPLFWQCTRNLLLSRTREITHSECLLLKNDSLIDIPRPYRPLASSLSRLSSLLNHPLYCCCLSLTSVNAGLLDVEVAGVVLKECRFLVLPKRCCLTIFGPSNIFVGSRSFLRVEQNNELPIALDMWSGGLILISTIRS